MHNAAFWRKHFENVFIPHIGRLVETLNTRLLPAFASIAHEASKIQEDTYNELMAMPVEYDPDFGYMEVDGFELNEAALQAGVDHYLGMSSVRQAILNSYAPLLYHTWEQQLLTFHRREVLHPNEQHDNKLLSVRELRRRLDAQGLYISALPTWAVLDELQLVANVAKHADGTSADKLKGLRPDLFEPDIGNTGRDSPRIRSTPRVYMPFSGDDLYVKATDLHTYGSAAVSFWTELPVALEADGNVGPSVA
ncbi:hypothetical protein WL09_03895 [Burkholderia ubonensis]|uniref:hypothetical protein n=1 Tax=Burkholderia ubonensis TaxID=101571 RepID=UPI0007553FB6|nr:hypothetical protein [Burkholderia ubonensis]KVX93186.1 hypothetical protein WL09_03895 [Burkholderia ubonensis]